MMQIVVHDVGHGACASIRFPNGKLLMFDCGAGGDEGFSPGACYWNQTIDMLTLQNLDHDHVEGICSLVGNVSIRGLFSNPSIGVKEFDALKTSGSSPALNLVRDVIAAFGPTVGISEIDLGGARVTWCWLNYGDAGISTTNDLSVVAVVEYGQFKIVFGGDLEKLGWQLLMLNPDIRRVISDANIFVASHHGRDSGRNEEAMGAMRPDVVIFSDKRRRYETQNTNSWYRRRTKGIVDRSGTENIFDPKLRHVLTTRRDGTLTINVNQFGRYVVYPGRASEPKTDSMLEFEKILALLDPICA
ncbi:ComEC/Rec2 family competence protein [Pyruvatibacter mobilis]|uniref:ComEC/Rec2 family competence protein n=1 Tax=Pyruvatibacter mobilis TaxID=1712261 RepID=UPI003BAE7A52